MGKYEKLFEPITIRSMTVKNRIVMSPMGTNMARLDGGISQEHVDYYVRRARGGVGLIIVENICVDYPLGSNGTTQLRIDNDQYVPGLYKLTEALHAYGASVCLQLNHAGSSSYPGRLGDLRQVSASAIPSKKGGSAPRPLEREEITAIVENYAKAAFRAQRAGFDSVEIHAGHGYLPHQFLSPLYNKRTDEFGGGKENRARFTRMIMEAVRGEVGPRFPLLMRVSAEEFIEGGNTLQDSLEILEHLVRETDVIDVSCALKENVFYHQDPMNWPDGWRSYMSKAVRDKFGIPTMASGHFQP